MSIFIQSITSLDDLHDLFFALQHDCMAMVTTIQLFTKNTAITTVDICKILIFFEFYWSHDEDYDWKHFSHAEYQLFIQSPCKTLEFTLSCLCTHLQQAWVLA